jgi:hypothetical protein
VRRAIASTVLFLAWSGAAGAAIAPQRIASDPFGATVAGQHSTIAEPDSFSFGSTVVSVFQVGRQVNGGAAAIGFATSLDGGSTWQSGILPSLTRFTVPAGPYSRVSDPVVAYDRVHGVWLASILALTDTPGLGTSAVVTSRSADGLSWSAPVVTARDIGSFAHDKNWIVCDNGAASPYAGRCYTVWTDVPTEGSLAMSTSLDGGATWGAEVFAPPNAEKGNGALPLVLPNGTLVVPYRSFEGELTSLRSTDGGARLADSTIVGAAPGGRIEGFRSPPLPSGEVAADGRLYLTWHTCAFRALCRNDSPDVGNDLALASTLDGVTWTTPRRIPLAGGATVTRVLPGLGVDASTAGAGTRLALVHYTFEPDLCGRFDCRVRAVFASSADAGATWSDPVVLSPQPMAFDWIAQTSQGRMLGDYFSTSYVPGGIAVPVFTSALPPSGGTFRQDLYAARVAPLPAARPLSLRVTRLVLAPRRVTPGAVLRATASISRSDEVRTLAGARLTCDARLRGKRLRVTVRRVRPGAVECAWRVPKGARGAVRGTITVRIGAASVARRFSVS